MSRETSVDVFAYTYKRLAEVRTVRSAIPANTASKVGVNDNVIPYAQTSYSAADLCYFTSAFMT
jgi:hypothetical protein